MSVFHPLRTRHGLHKVRTPVTAGALLGPDVYRFFHAIGLDLRQLYGVTEAGNVTGQKDDDTSFDTIGRPLPSVELRISEDNEILIAKRNCFIGYYKNPEATEKAFAGGWYHTGDAGYIADDGQAVFMDRLSDLRQLKDGTKFSPQFVESQLKFSTHFRDAMVVEPEDMSMVAVIINIDYANVGYWAEKRRIPYTTFTDLSQQPEVRNLIRAEVERVNRKLPAAARVKRFVNLYKDFDADEAELTRTKKLRRGFMAERYRDLVDALFGVDKELKIESRISYLDGRTGVVATTVHIEDL
jgi:long-chain acyl-CoA synthetase